MNGNNTSTSKKLLNLIGNNAVPFDLYAYVPTTAGSLTLTLTVSFEYDTTKTVTASVTLTPQSNP